MEEHRRILELGERGTLPDRVDDSSELAVSIVRELVEAGYLAAIDACSMDGNCYLDPRITLAGRDYLRELRQLSESSKIDVAANIQRMKDIMIAVSTGG